MWIYKDKELVKEDIEDKHIGFIYCIVNTFLNKKYIGRKLLTKAAYKVIKGKKKKIRKESDWKEYWSSSPDLLKDYNINPKHFKKEILIFCTSLSQLNYYEEKLQYSLSVLESENWYNSNIRAKVFKKNILNKVDNIDNIINQLK